MPGNIDLSLDGLYRALVGGLQTGLGFVIIFWLLGIVFWLPILSLYYIFVLGTLVGAAYTLYQDTLKVHAFLRISSL
jgi:ABC-type xylose transport system permease subunit